MNMDFFINFFEKHIIISLILIIIFIIVLILYIIHKLNYSVNDDLCKYTGYYVGRDKINSKSSNDGIISLIEKYYKEGEKK